MKYTIIVKTSAKRPESIQTDENGALVVTARAKPINGEANKAVVALLSNHFKIPKTRINIISGLKSKKKIVEIN